METTIQKKMKTLLPLTLLTLLFIASACGNYKVSESDAIIDFPDEESQYPGGVEQMKKYLAENIKYPEVAMVNGDQGKVFVEFIVEKDGAISNVTILRGVSREIDAEAKRVVEEMPKWTPAAHKKKYVRSRARIPINFILV